jgi:3-polyprenyl-4-hydroxybenzoate decarboxylase
MATNVQKIVLSIGGSSGAIYAKLLMDRLVQLQDQWEKVGVVMSNNAQFNWEYELGNRDYNQYPCFGFCPLHYHDRLSLFNGFIGENSHGHVF